MVENFEEEEVSKYTYLSNEILIRIRFRPPSPECKTPDMFVSVQVALKVYSLTFHKAVQIAPEGPAAKPQSSTAKFKQS